MDDNDEWKESEYDGDSNEDGDGAYIGGGGMEGEEEGDSVRHWNRSNPAGVIGPFGVIGVRVEVGDTKRRVGRFSGEAVSYTTCTPGARVREFGDTTSSLGEIGAPSSFARARGELTPRMCNLGRARGVKLSDDGDDDEPAARSFCWCEGVCGRLQAGDESSSSSVSLPMSGNGTNAFFLTGVIAESLIRYGEEDAGGGDRGGGVVANSCCCGKVGNMT